MSERTLEDAQLLASELVANAIEHVREEGDIELRVSVAKNVLRVEVLDPGPGFTAPRHRVRSRLGTALLDRLAARWAVDREAARGCGSNCLAKADRRALP